MLRTSLKGLLAHKRRLIGTMLAIVLGVGFLAGTLVLSDTVKRSFNGLFASIYQGTDVQVRGVEKFNLNFNSTRELLDEGLVAKIRAVPGVREATPFVQGFAVILGHDGKPVGSTFGPPRAGASWSSSTRTNPFHVVEGRAPTGPGEVVVDRGSARHGGLHVGEQVRVQGATLASYRLVGVVQFGAADSPLGATFALFDLPTAQRALGTPGKVDSVAVVGDGRVGQAELAGRIQGAISGAPAEAITGDRLLADSKHNAQGIADAFDRTLLIFAVVALFVSCFVIYNTFTVLIAQRTRELAMLRAVGATGGQVLGSVVLEAAVVGLVASALGLAAGVGVFFGLKLLFSTLGFDLPLGSMVLAPRTVISGLIVGGLVTTVSALVPALRAARVAPIAALRDVAVDRSEHSRSRVVIGGLVLALGVAELAHGLVGGTSLSGIGLGMLATLIGLIVLGPVIAAPLARLIGAPLRRVGGLTGALAQQNAARNPGRTASTASALMIGVALVTFVTVFAGSLTASNDRLIDRQFQGDFTVTAGGAGGGGADRGGLPVALAPLLARLPGIAAVTPVRNAPARVDGKGVAIYGVDSRALDKIVDVKVSRGSLAALGPQGIAVRKAQADQRGLTLGSTVNVLQARGPERPFTVRAIFDADNLTGPSTKADYVLDLAAFDAGQVVAFDQQLLVKVAAGRSPASVRPAIERALAPYGLAEVLDKAQFKAAQSTQINVVLQLIYGLLGLAVVIAILGIGNTLSLSAIERGREFGLLRAVGMRRRQLRRTMLLEAVIIALLGTLVGLGVGLVFGATVVRTLRGQGIDVLRVPVVPLVIVVVVAVAAALLAAVLPARRASRLSVIDAVTND